MLLVFFTLTVFMLVLMLEVQKGLAASVLHLSRCVREKYGAGDEAKKGCNGDVDTCIYQLSELFTLSEHLGTTSRPKGFG